MPDIELQNPFVTRTDINLVIEFVKKIKAGEAPPELHFIAKEEMNDIELSFLGYLALCKMEHDALSIKFSLQKNYRYNKKDKSTETVADNLGHKLVQAGVHFFLLIGKIPYTIEFKDGPCNFNFKDDKQFKDGHWLIISGRFIPSLIISSGNHQLFETLFESKLSDLCPWYRSGVQGVDWVEKNDKLSESYWRQLHNTADPENHTGCLVILGIMSFYKSLESAKITAFFTDELHQTPESRRENMRAGTLDTEMSYRHYHAIKGIFEELAEKPIVHQFIFSTLLDSELLPTALKKENKDSFQETIIRLWHFSKDLVHGLQELARNILIHSRGKGVVTARIIREEVYSDNSVFFQNYLGYLKSKGVNNVDYFFDIRVIDTGTKGIIPTLLENSKAMVQKLPAIEEDVKQLENGSFGLADLLNPKRMSKLLQQSQRAVAHIGLLTFSNLIITNNGVLKATSLSLNRRRDTATVPAIGNRQENAVEYGTSFTVILPVRTDIRYETHLPHELHFPGDYSVGEVKGIEELFEFENITDRHLAAKDLTGKKLIFTCTLPPMTIRGPEDEAMLYKKFTEILNDYISTYKLPAKHKHIINVDLETVVLNESHLLRFLGQWELDNPRINLMISNIRNEVYQAFRQVNEKLVEHASKSLGFWNENCPTIINSYVTDDEKNRFYFADVLLGKTRADFLQVNRSVRRNHFNSTNGLPDEPPSGTQARRISSVAFSNGKTLLPFDLILKTPGGLKLFEANASMLLQNEIRPRDHASHAGMIAMIRQLHGFKVIGSHYRIGSKLHISDFYYAKRIFQNNFFASRFAFMVAQEILVSLSEADLKMVRKGALTLVGYGLYAELMLSLLAKLLTKSPLLKDVDINHELIKDDESVSLLKRVELHDNIIIVVPIASTFSTAVKIEKLLTSIERKKPEKLQILPPHYNLLHISDGPENDIKTPLESELGWMDKNKTNKTITLKAFFENDNSIKTQKYFISLPSEWQKIEDCRHCFPVDKHKKEDPVREEALFESERKEINPGFIFGFPRGRKLSKEDRNRQYTLSPSMIKLRQYSPHNSHFIYSIDSEQFLRENENEIRKWLRDMKKEKHPFHEKFKRVTHTLLVASCHEANAAFIDLVNEELFGSSVNVIHYEPSNDHIQNFELIFGYEIEAAEKIIFIDDTLKSGDTFSRINEFVHQIRSRSKKKCNNPGIDACIILINKAHSFVHNAIQARLTDLKEIYGFANLNIFSSLSMSNTSTLFQEKSRYLQLIHDSMGDGLKFYFLGQIRKLKRSQEIDTDADNRENGLTSPYPKSAERHLLMLEATHLIYDFFATHEEGIGHFEQFDDFIRALTSTTTSPLQYEMENPDSVLGLEPLHACVLKSLTQYPFTQYEPLRRKVFGWVIKLLDQHLKHIEEEIGNDDSGTDSKFNFPSYQGLRFLIRRATLMNANYLLSERMFEVVKLLYSPRGLAAIKEGESGYRLVEIETFTVYLVAQIKELLSRNFSRSLRLEKLLNRLQDDGLKGFTQLIRILRGENSLTIQRFYESLRLNPAWLKLYELKKPEKPKQKNEEQDQKDQVDTSLTPLENFLKTEEKRNPQRFRLLEEYFADTGQNALMNNRGLLNYLWIKNFIEVEQSMSDLLITDRSRFIFDKLASTFEGLAGIDNIGIFLSVNYSNEKSYLAYDKNNKGGTEMDRNNWDKIQTTFLGNFQDGIKDISSGYYRTYIELKKHDPPNKWINLYATEEATEKEQLDHKLFPQHINRIILLRLEKRLDKKLGMLGIYFTNDNEGFTDLNTVRYLLLLKSCIGEFIERHHLNNEFRDWLIAENTKRLAVLSGHGKEMLQQIALKNEDFQKIAIDLEEVQLIMILHENIKEKNSFQEIRKKFDQFYNLKGSNSIDYSYLQRLEKMAKDIFREKRIETIVEADISLDKKIPRDFYFEFDERILNLICFEVFLNAKKNRWHFPECKTPEEKSGAKFNRNELTIAASITKKNTPRQMTLTITNSGPQVNKDTMDNLTYQHKNVKSNDITAGTSLIKTLIWEIFEGKVLFDCQQASANYPAGLHFFSISLVLTEMKRDV